ncbi:MAG: MBL fold metallo-hydrolase [Bacteroidia bacterium]|jgi:glyoxylase-like metal-dependent hydrolase (beta-lactamase superfamily II)/rhodanese-related sulfurtransferase
MKIEQIYTGCLAHGAYYIESEGEAAIIDPLRETEPYITRAEKNSASIKYVLETHFHADFVSGHLDLARQTGATIVYGPTAKPGFEAHVAQDGEILALGKVKIQVLHTPGHTMESSCFLLFDENGKMHSLFTGDTLFIGDVGRPDLAQHVISELTQEKLASHLYDSLRNKIMPLPDALIVYPGHGAGSACGKNMSNETTDTLGHQKQSNYALRADMTKEEFMAEVLSGLMPPPGYFPQNVLLNIKGYESFDKVMRKGKQALSPISFEAAANETEAVIIDTRDPQVFAQGFIPNSINVGIDGSFATWVGTLVPDVTIPLLLVCDTGREDEAITRLSRVGFDNCLGYLHGGFEAWQQAGNEVDRIESISAAEFADIIEQDPASHNLQILDVRKKSEFQSEHIPAAINAPLDYINDSMLLVNPTKTGYVHCAGGYRSMVFISILKARGYNNLIDIQGGFKAIKATEKVALTAYLAPTTML